MPGRPRPPITRCGSASGVDNHAWEFESLHQKLYLSNRPDEVQKFAISHGYNINMLNYALSKYGFIYRIGGGFVMTHPETQVRGKRLEDEGGFNGFYISGAGDNSPSKNAMPSPKNCLSP